MCEFLQANGTKKSFSWSDVDAEVPSSAVKAFVSGVLSNSAELLDAALASAVSAKIRTTEDTVFDLSA